MKSMKTQTKDKDAKRRSKSILFVLASCSIVLLVSASGCGNKFFDPTQVGRFRPVPAVNVILDSLAVAEETEVAWEGGEEPRPSDTVVMETDYVFRSGDIVMVSIFELLEEGRDAIYQPVVTETGKISIPDVGVIEAAGLTETQLEEEIRQILAPSILKDPAVVVTLLASQQRTFSILGDGVAAPNRYVIPRYDFRLTDALATAGGLRQFNVSYIYVSRFVGDQGSPPGLLDTSLGIETLEPGGPDKEMQEIIAPHAQQQSWPSSNVVIASSEMARAGEFGTAVRRSSYANANNVSALPGGQTGFGASPTASLKGESPMSSTATPALEIEVEPATESATLGGASMWEETGQDDQVSVGDILKTLAARSQQQTKAAATEVPAITTHPTRTLTVSPTEVPSFGSPRPANNILSNNQPEPEPPVEDQTNSIDSILKTLEDRSRPGPAELEVGPPPVGGVPSVQTPPQSGGVDSILKSLEERPGRTTEDEQTDWENVLKSFAEPEPAQTEPEDEMTLDELLKSFAEPETGVKTDEQIGPEDVGMDIPVVDVPAVGPGEAEVGVAPGETGKGPGEVKIEPGRIEWIFQDGKWVPMQVGGPAVPRPVIKIEPVQEPVVSTEPPPTGTMEYGGAQTRLIKIPADKLRAGDPRYNIVIKPGDSIHVPVDLIGEFCVMGNVVRQGYIPITGRPLNLKMAIAAAGGLGPLAWPKRVEVVRRIGPKREEIVMVDLEKIASGQQPDFFIKPNDLINVGTHATARWRAVLRNAFRATYGFGFIYDRNFAQKYYAGSDLWPLGD